MGTVQAGKLDRRVILQSPVSAQDGSGRPVTRWYDHDTVWAEIRDVAAPSEEGVEQGLAVARRQCWVTIRWRDDVGAEMRLLHEGRTLRIISEPAEIGRREGLKFKAEELTTGGQEP